MIQSSKLKFETIQALEENMDKLLQNLEILL